ncbi:MAG TPA: endonuclease Q family protein [Opitutaceae bacterium]|nr:endonuclease Q family protein [Opitutaceae bacterium]
MLLAADLHLHSRYSTGVSPAMTLENIAVWALRKGLDVLGTGDCLQPNWLREIEASTAPSEGENGFLRLTNEVQERVWSRVPIGLRRPLRFVLSTEVDCLPPTKTKFQGLHHLLYFPTFDSAHAFAEELRAHGDLSEGRPTVNLTPLQLLERTLEHGPRCHFAPAHVFNPWFSDLGTVGGETSLEELYVDLTAELLGVETGLTSIPPMCRRVSSLDRHALFSCSDAHSLENLGREYTVVDCAPNYDALFAALADVTARQVVQTIKLALYETPYYLNWCSNCKAPFDAVICPTPGCRRALVTGARDRLEKIADRAVMPAAIKPVHQELRPLPLLIARTLRTSKKTASAQRVAAAIVDRLGHERYVLTEATEAEIAGAGLASFARPIVEQRGAGTDYFRTTLGAAANDAASQTILNLDLPD